ncbi:HipA domain-containing protein [Actimicrobium sp. CCI2.3]|uniref:type II toxin-antitoxin system HipA family toxin n=1 Tax=Actimicrobium sp. CCI2.3 TaxID=3048616 RepID=UPI002AB430BC|nr:HipA domain-containing protein [Actimicrobium sp. CCI2.3]MDY7573873.1 HipA domain-containing protein [Actimicrobium sp. CCI2.3]MEB0023405.1 HipA domain-containing protein [Actimicrobium sp. CCI2.3]
MSENLCYVYVQLPGTYEWVPCASLKVKKVAADAFEGTFTYGKRYLERANVMELDPYHLKLTAKPMKFTMLKGIPGVLRDASPDAWGRRVIQARLEKEESEIAEMEYLLNGPDDGAGNLRFGLSVQPPGPAKPFNRTHQLDALVQAAEQLEETGKLPYEVLEQLEPGTSMGGARPKVTIEDDHCIYLAKLPEKRDKHNMQRIEYATLELARAAGLHVCGTRIESVGKAEALMLLRFDREWNPDASAYIRHGLASGLTVLNAEDGIRGRERWSYLLLADEIRRWSVKPDADRLELFKRMVFNAMVTNNDDHPRNHAMLRTTASWRLSPAYDIVPVPLLSLERRDLALEVGKFGRVASLYNILSDCGAFGLSREEAETVIAQMEQVVRGWKEFFFRYGVEERSIEYIGQAILPECFFRREPVDTLA